MTCSAETRPESSTKSISSEKATTRHGPYTAGNPDSASELVQFMTSKTEADIATIPINSLAIAVTQAYQTIAEWEPTIFNCLQPELQAKGQYIAGELDSAPELVRFMTCKTKTNLTAISAKDLLIAAKQAYQTIAKWEVIISNNQRQCDNSKLYQELMNFDISSVDLSQLLGGEHFTVSCKVAHNGYAVKTSGLADSGANGFVFVDTRFARDLMKFLNITPVSLSKPCTVKGYDGRPGKPISEVLILHLEIDGHRQKDVPMLILDLGNHDLIIGRKWFDYFDVWLDVRNKRLIWPRKRPSESTFAKEICTPRENLQITAILPRHQADVERRDRAFALEDKRRADGRKSTVAGRPADNSPDQSQTIVYHPDPAMPKPHSKLSTIPGLRKNRTFEKDLRDNLQKMNQELRKIENIEPQATKAKIRKNRYPPNLPSIDIAMIGAAGYHRNLRKEGTVPFVTSLYEIDRLIDEKQASAIVDEETDEQAVERLLPKEYADLRDVFSKTISDKLAPHRSYDHRIELEAENTLGFSPLRQHSLEELLAAKKYIEENLHKGFIAPSQAPFASPILFARKANGSLRFCVDYRKLNALTRKDRYPLPLIDKTLARLSQAKIFTKLDIRQAFHKIRIHSNSEELTTFRTRYGTYKYKVLPFGLTNGPATFQRYINDIFFDILDDFVTSYLDDILVYSENELEHIEHVRKVIMRL
jgi:hypothetical protein